MPTIKLAFQLFLTPTQVSYKDSKPCTVYVVETLETLFSTVQLYSPGFSPVTVRVWLYCAVSVSSNTVTFPSVTVVVESLVQVTVVAGPPVEIQVRVNWGLSPLRSKFTVKVTPSGIASLPIIS